MATTYLANLTVYDSPHSFDFAGRPLCAWCSDYVLAFSSCLLDQAWRVAAARDRRAWPEAMDLAPFAEFGGLRDQLQAADTLLARHPAAGRYL